MPKFSKHFCSEMDKSVFWMVAPHLRAYATHKCSKDGRRKWKWKVDDCVGLRFAAAVVILSDYCAHNEITKRKAEDILSRLDMSGCLVRAISLVCSVEELRERLEKDVAAGIRQPDVIDRSVARLPLYEDLDSERIDTTGLAPEQVASRIANL